MQHRVMHDRTSPITAFRKSIRMSLEDFGKLMNPCVDKSTVSRWERSRIPAERMADVARVIGVPLEKLRPDIFKATPRKRPAVEIEAAE